MRHQRCTTPTVLRRTHVNDLGNVGLHEAVVSQDETRAAASLTPHLPYVSFGLAREDAGRITWVAVRALAKEEEMALEGKLNVEITYCVP